MFTKFNLTNIAIATTIVALLAFGIVFSKSYKQNQRCGAIEIRLTSNNEGYLVTKSSLEDLLTNKGRSPIIGKKFNLLNLQELEQKVLKNRLVKNCQISKTVGSTLLVQVEEEEPIARIVPMSQNGSHFEGYYVNDEGKLFPLSDLYTKKVCLLSGAYFVGKKSLKSKADRELVGFLKTLYKDKFWRSNISQIVVDADKNIVMHPTIGNFKIEIGKARTEENENKLQKIKIFYKHIAPQVGDRYSQISVKYEGQIVGTLQKELSTTTVDSVSIGSN